MSYKLVSRGSPGQMTSSLENCILVPGCNFIITFMKISSRSRSVPCLIQALWEIYQDSKPRRPGSGCPSIIRFIILSVSYMLPL